MSDGCGYKFEVVVVSGQFEGKPLLQRHSVSNINNGKFFMKEIIQFLAVFICHY